jgi:hypothetical protein
MLARVEYPRVAEQFEPGAVRVIHHEESNPIGGTEVARADQLTVTLEICEANTIRSQHLYEPRWTATVLDVWPTRLAHGRQVEAVA